MNEIEQPTSEPITPPDRLPQDTGDQTGHQAPDPSRSAIGYPGVVLFQHFGPRHRPQQIIAVDEDDELT